MHDIIVGLGFGDEGKGTMTDYLSRVRHTDAIVRFSGGPQTAHNVVLPDGTHHTFAQFGSGTFAGAKTILSRFALVNIFNLENEANNLWKILREDPVQLLYVSENARLITPLHIAANHAYEIRRGADAHGSCGEGVGETMRYSVAYPDDTIIVRDLKEPASLRRKLDNLMVRLQSEYGRHLSVEELNIDIQHVQESLLQKTDLLRLQVLTDEEITDYIADTEKAGKKLVFEGTQGILLDEWNGFHPHTTWSTTTSQNAHTLLDEAGVPQENRQTIGITRTYHTRHGYGPFPSEFPTDYEWEEKYPERHNAHGRWQGNWRVGHLDLDLLDYAIRVDGRIDTLAVTHADVAVDTVAHIPGFSLDVHGPDRLDEREKVTRRLMNPRVSSVFSTDDIMESIRTHTGKSISYISSGPTWEDKKTA